MDSLLSKLHLAAITAKKVKLNHEELKQALLMLATEDVKQRFHIGNVIQQQGPKSLPELISAMSFDQPEIRRTVAHVLGKLAIELVAAGQPVPPELMATLHGGLLDEDPKVRWNSTVALGDLKISESVNHLIEAHSKETSTWVRPSMILAMGSIGGSEVTEYLSSYQPNDSRERSALQKVLDRSIGERSDWRFVKHLAQPIPIELWAVEGIENTVAKGVREQLSLPVLKVAPGRVQTSTADAYSLFALRSFTELLIPLAKAQMKPPCEKNELLKIVEEKLEQDGILDRILSLHEDGQQIMRYRLEIRGKELKHQDRRTIIMEIADRIAATCPAFVNSTSNYNVEIRILLEENSAEILLKPFTILDDRFSYRVKDVPAAINPSAAAGVISLAPDLFAHGRVLDPFCGSGTMLIERAQAGSYDKLVGIDISRAAIEAAQQNVKIAGLPNVTLIRDDMRRVSHEALFDEIITNMPFGIRTGKHSANVKLYQDFFDLIPRILTKHGFVLLYTQEVLLTTNLFRKSKQLKLCSINRVQSGGLRPAIFVGVRK
ncbi:MAG: methyltransferase domain-containing protein [Armatimonadetes bacterium]|nr:methyltransferase domain-containing protein [Armatimonadota bacterium]